MIILIFLIIIICSIVLGYNIKCLELDKKNGINKH